MSTPLALISKPQVPHDARIVHFRHQIFVELETNHHTAKVKLRDRDNAKWRN